MKSCETSASALAVFVLVRTESVLLSPTHFPDWRKPECLCFGGRIKEDFWQKQQQGLCQWWGGDCVVLALPSCWRIGISAVKEYLALVCSGWHGCATVVLMLRVSSEASLWQQLSKAIAKVIAALCACRCSGRLCSASYLWGPCCGVFSLIMISWQLLCPKYNFTFCERGLFPHEVFWSCSERAL